MSMGDVSVLLANFTDKVKVITPAEARNFLKALNISVSTEQESSQQRVVKYNFTITFECCVVMVIKITDRNFPFETPEVRPMDRKKGDFVLLEQVIL
jgi:hypothetical protein